MEDFKVLDDATPDSTFDEILIVDGVWCKLHKDLTERGVKISMFNSKYSGNFGVILSRKDLEAMRDHINSLLDYTEYGEDIRPILGKDRLELS